MERFFSITLLVSAITFTSLPASAETVNEISNYVRKVNRNDVRNFEQCAEAQRMTESCGLHGARIVCDMNGLTIIAGESGLLGHFAGQIADVTDLVADYVDYLDALIEQNLMPDVGAMNTPRMRSYCGSIHAAVVP